MELKKKIDEANQEAVNRMINSKLVWVDVHPAIEVIPGMKKNLILHAGPPITFKRMCRPQKNAVIGAVIYEGLASTEEEVDELCASGEICLEPCHEHKTVGSMCGVTSASMNVLVVKNETYGNSSFCLIYESPERERLSFGVNSEAVLENIRWIDSNIAVGLRAGLKEAGSSIDLKHIIARALTMGDELHSRNFASTALFSLELMPYLIRSSVDNQIKQDVADFVRRSDQFFLHFVMAAGKAIADAAKNVKYSSIVTAIARNGVEVGIKVSGLGEQWFTGPAGIIEGLFFNPYGPEDAQADLGDSAITETSGLGGLAHAASPSLAIIKSGDANDALRITEEMRLICFSQNPNFGIPIQNGAGAPVGIDIRKVMNTGILPLIDTGIAHKEGGQIGVGNARAPKEAFKKALEAFGKMIKSQSK